MKKKTTAKTGVVTEASRYVKQLRARGLSFEGIADQLKVGVPSVKRWAAGTHNPLPGALARLKELVHTKQ